MSIAAAAAELKAAAETVDGVRVYLDPGATFDPPAVLIAPPALDFTVGLGGPTNARFIVAVFAAADERALETLWDLVPQVAAAIDHDTDGVVTSALPSAWRTGGTELPCYELIVEVPL